MTKKILMLFILFSLLISSIFAQSKKIEIKVPSYTNDKKLTETTYEKEYPKTYEEAISTIETLIDVYNEVSKNYKDQLTTDEEIIDDVIKELKNAKEENIQLKEIIQATQETNTSIDTTQTNFNVLKNNIKFGIIGEYGCLFGSNEVSLQLGFKLFNFTFQVGPNISIPTNNDENIKFGFRGGLGYWF